MHDPVARRDHVHVLEGLGGPVDEVEAVGVAALLDLAVAVEGGRVGTVVLHRQRVVDDQLHRHHRVHLRRIAALLGDRVTQPGQVDQRGLAQDVVADHAGGEPREVQVAAALHQLAQVGVDPLRLGAADDVLGVHPRRVGQAVPGARLQAVHRLAGIEVVELGAGERLAVLGIHGGPGVARGSRAGGGHRAGQPVILPVAP